MAEIRVPWAAVIAVAVLVLVSSAGLSWQLRANREHEIRQWEARLGAMATDRARGLDRWIVERWGDARVLAQDLGPEGATPGELALSEEELALAVAAYGYGAGWLLDADGRVLAGTPDAAPYPGELTLAHRAMASQETEPWFFTEPEAHVSFAAPLPQGRGAVVLRANPERYLFPFLESEALPTRTGETLLARAEGDSVVFLNHPRMGTTATATERPLADPDLAMAAALRGQEVFGSFTDYRDVPVFAATRALENAPWGLVVKVDREEALAEHRTFRGILLAMVAGLVLAVLAGVLAFTTWRRSRERETAAEALRLSEEKHRLLFEQSRDAIFVTAPDGRLLDVNPACAELFAVDPDHLERYDARQFYVDPSNRDRFRRLMLEEGGVTDFEVRLQDARGNPFVGLYSAAVIRDPEGAVAGFQGTVRDITERKEAEERIRASEERLRLTYQHAPMGVAMVALDGTFSQVNPALAHMVGYDPEELEGKTFQEITHPDDLDDDLGYVEDLLDGRIDSYELEKRYLHRDGRVVWVHLTGSLVRRSDGEPLHFVAHVHDISERVEVRRELQASEHRFRSLIEQGSELISLIDAQGITRYQSPAFERILGYEEGALVGVDSFQLVHPDEREEIRQAFEEILERPGGRAQVEYRFRHADGEWRVLETRAINLVDDAAVGGVVVNSRDVTERREAQAAVAESETRLHAILDTVTEAVVLMDLEGTIRYANPAIEEILSVPETSVVGRRFDDPSWTIRGMDGEPLPSEAMPFQRVMDAGGPAYDILLAVERPDGREVVLSVNAAPVRREGEVRAVVASVQDVTERIRAQKEVERLNRELEERVRQRTAELAAVNQELEAFAYSVSHDLRAPLRALDGFSQALAEDYADRLDEAGLDFLRRIQTNSRRMARLIDDILQLSRISRKELTREEVDLAHMAREIVAELREAEPDRRVELAAPDTLPARGDPALLRVVLDNLLGNAWKFTQHEEEAHIELGVDDSGEERTYWVRDDGVGFDMEYVDKLFKAFQRLHRDSEFEGTGIGLATVGRIVRRHGGSVEAEGTEGEGTTVRFTLGERAGG